MSFPRKEAASPPPLRIGRPMNRTAPRPGNIASGADGFRIRFPHSISDCETSNMIENCQHECGFHMDTYNSDRRATVPSASQATGRVFVSSDDLSESSALESLIHRNHSTLAPSCGATIDRDQPPARRSRRRRPRRRVHSAAPLQGSKGAEGQRKGRAGQHGRTRQQRHGARDRHRRAHARNADHGQAPVLELGLALFGQLRG